MIPGWLFFVAIVAGVVLTLAIETVRNGRRHARAAQAEDWGQHSHVRVFDQEDPYALSDEQVETLEGWLTEDRKRVARPRHAPPPRMWGE